MMTKSHKQNSTKWGHTFLKNNPKASLNELLREAKNSGNAMHRDQALRLRKDFFQTEQNVVSEKDEPTRADRKAYLNKILEEDPTLTVRTATAKLKEKFGMALDAGYINATVKIARQVHEAALSAPPDIHHDEVPIINIAQKMIDNISLTSEEEMLKISWMDSNGEIKNNSFRASDLKAEIRRLVLEEGVKPEHVEVWKKVNVLVQINVQLG